MVGISGGYIGIVWVWNLVRLFSPPSFVLPADLVQIWFFPLDLIKFGMRALITKYNAGRALRAPPAVDDQGVPLARTQSRAASIHESMYGNRVSFIKRAQRMSPFSLVELR